MSTEDQTNLERKGTLGVGLSGGEGAPGGEGGVKHIRQDVQEAAEVT